MRRTAALIIAAVASTSAWAAGDLDADLLKNGYFGLNGGRADYRWRNPDFAVVHDLCSPSASKCDTWAGGWRLYGGYMVTRFFGVEFAAFRFGDVGQRFEAGGAVLNQDIHIHGYGLSAVGEVPLGRFALHGRAGYGGVTAVRTDEETGFPTTRDEKTSAQPIFGAGASLRVWKGLRVHVDIDYTRARTRAAEKFDVKLISLGGSYRF